MKAASNFAIALSEYCHPREDHVNDDDNNGMMQEIQSEADLCPLHHLAVKDCLRELVHRDVWRQQESRRGLSRLIKDIYSIHDPRDFAQDVSFGDCNKAYAVILTFRSELAALKQMVQVRAPTGEQPGRLRLREPDRARI